MPEGELAAIEARRPTLTDVQRAINAYPWPTLIGNLQMEIVCWNEPAQRVAELDFASAFPQIFQRHLLRISAHPNFYGADPATRRVVNWDEIIAVLISMMKAAGQDIGQPEADTVYFQQLIQDVSTDYPDAFQEVIRLWMTTPPLRELTRVVFPATWRLTDGTILRFETVISIWSEFDGAWAFDWFPADGTTWTWLERTAPPAGSIDQPAADALTRPWWRQLRDAREGTGMTRRQLAKATLWSVAALEKYETGESLHPDRDLIVALTQALDVDGIVTNAILEGAGLEPEASDLARTLAKVPVRGTYNLRWQQAIEPRIRITRIQTAVAAHPWPVALLNSQGVIVYCNPALQRVVGHDNPEAIQSLRRQHLLRFVTSSVVQEQLLNWKDVAPALAPPPIPLSRRSKKSLSCRTDRAPRAKSGDVPTT
ncbi:MAG: helix-turn-helix domain-containing protein [Dehalococcoidia bacterium]